MNRADWKSSRVKRVVLLAGIGAGLLLAGPLAGESRAGTYTSADCASANGGYSAAHYDYSHPMALVTAACGPGGNGLGISLPSPSWSPNQTGASWSIGTPPGTYFNSAWMLQRGASHPAAGWEIEVFAFAPGSAVPLGAWKDGSSAWRGIGPATGHYGAITSRLTCVAAGGCYGSPQAGIFIRDLLFNMVDEASPTASAGGELLSGEVQRGAGSLELSAKDTGSGITRTYVAVNGQIADAQSYGCPGVASSTMAPCALSQQTHYVLDTQSPPFHDGANQVQACAVDYATTSAPNVGCGPLKAVQVDNSCPASKVAGGTELTARFPRSDKDTVTVRSRQSALVKGRLSDHSGDPVERAALCIREATPGTQLADVGTVKTNDAGRYRYTVGPGPNRVIEVGYRYNRHELHREVHYRAKVTPSLKLSRGKVRNGRRIRLFGRLPGPSNEDRIVVLQARYPGKHQRWKTFQKARTNQAGQYTAPYRFLSTFVTTAYEMRAVAPAQNGYPFLAGHSRARHIRVIGR